MQQGYIPPDQQPQRRSRKQNPKFLPSGGRNSIIIGLVLFIFGVAGVAGIEAWAGKILFLLIASGGVFMLVLPFAMKAKEKEKSQQQIQRQPVSSAPTPPAEFINAAGHLQGSLYEFVPVRVAGVTFKNGRRHRQTILRQIYWKDEPYHKGIEVTLRQGEYEGQPTVEVWANEEQIGFVPKEQLPFFLNNWHRYHSAFDLEVSGGGNMPDGEQVPFGAEFTARFTV